jgi:hypothetical protein
MNYFENIFYEKFTKKIDLKKLEKPFEYAHGGLVEIKSSIVSLALQ